MFGHCLKVDEMKPPQPQRTKELMISPLFDWSTTKTIELSIKGIPGAYNNRKTLTVYHEDKVFYKELYNIKENIRRDVIIPAYLNTLSISFGQFTRTFDVSSRKLTFSFVDTEN